jgi:predicted dehydrogenase
MAVRVGVIGAGGMANYHIDGFRNGGADVVAIADLNEAAAKAAAESYGIPLALGSVEALLEHDLDAVSIITPNKFHCPLSLQALKAGKHVFCEKPPAISAAEAQQMAEAAKAADKVLMFNFNNRARPESFALMDAIKAGEVGEINSAQAKWCRRTGIPGFGGWFTTKAMSGGGALIDLLHMLDLSLYFMGYPEPAHVLAQTYDTFIDNKNFKGPWGIPDRADGVTDVEAACHAFLTFAGGKSVSVQISWAEMVKREEVSATFQGSKAGGMIQRLFAVDGMDDTAIDTCELYTQEHGRQANKTLVVQPDESMGRIRSAENFVRAIAGEEAPLNTPDQAVKLMQIIDAIYASAAGNKPVAIG